MQRINLTTRTPGPSRALLVIADLSDDELDQMTRGLKALLAQQGVHRAEGFTADGPELAELRKFIGAGDDVLGLGSQ